MISAITVSPRRRRLGMYFSMQRENVRQKDVVRFPAQLRRRTGRAMVVVLNRLAAHRAAAMKLKKRRPSGYEFEWLPSYSPELNPVEFLWGHAKYGDLANFVADDFKGWHTSKLNFVLESLVARYGLPREQLQRYDTVHLDLDTSVEPLFGQQQGAEVGYNPRYRGRPSYHPILAALAETRTCAGALLRPGDTSLGKADVDTVAKFVRRTRMALGDAQSLRVRVDAGGDCCELMSAIEDQGELFVVKARLTRDLCLAATGAWHLFRHLFKSPAGRWGPRISSRPSPARNPAWPAAAPFSWPDPDKRRRMWKDPVLAPARLSP